MASLRELTEIIDNETLLRDSFVLKKKLRGIVGHRDEPGFREQLDLFAVEAEDARNRYLKKKGIAAEDDLSGAGSSDSGA